LPTVKAPATCLLYRSSRSSEHAPLPLIFTKSLYR